MPERVGRKAIARAISSISRGGTLELGFFGGEPLLEARLISGLIAYARDRAARRGIGLALGLTTNGAVGTAEAWSLMMLPDMELAVSHDGLPQVHNRHRRFADGCRSSARVLQTMERLAADGKEFRTVMVVRPDTVDFLSAGMQFLRAIGVRRLEPTLDLWAEWTSADVGRLESAIHRCAGIWEEGLPELGISWFEEKAALLARVPITKTARCGFGEGQVAIAPSGSLYPCERLIGEDAADNPARLRGSVSDGRDFLSLRPPPACSCETCISCAIHPMCNTDCRCSNCVRTGDAGRPDGPLCALNRTCVNETARTMEVALEGGVI
jgi:uncharacterized protein